MRGLQPGGIARDPGLTGSPCRSVSYSQGFMLMREAAAEYKWKLNYAGLGLMWRGGCIIRRYVACANTFATVMC